MNRYRLRFYEREEDTKPKTLIDNVWAETTVEAVLKAAEKYPEVDDMTFDAKLLKSDYE